MDATLWVIVVLCCIDFYVHGDYLPPGCEEYQKDLVCVNVSLTRVPLIRNEFERAILSNNHITEVEANKFLFSGHLVTLDLSFNLISRINKTTFQFLKELRTLFLGANRITDIDPSAFKKNTKLESLYLNSNPIHLPENRLFLESYSILELSLGNCDLSVIPTASFSTLYNLRRLDVRGNDLNYIPRDTLDSIPLLTELTVNDESYKCVGPTWKNVSEYMLLKHGKINIKFCSSNEITSFDEVLNNTDSTNSKVFHLNTVTDQPFVLIDKTSSRIMIAVMVATLIINIYLIIIELRNRRYKVLAPVNATNCQTSFWKKYLSLDSAKGCVRHVVGPNSPETPPKGSCNPMQQASCPKLLEEV